MKRIIFGLIIAAFFSAFAQTLAEVNGKKISLKFLRQELEKLPLAQQEDFIEDYPRFLEELINQELLLQEALRQKLDTISEIKFRITQNKPIRNQILIDELLNRKIRSKIIVTEEEMIKYFKDNREQMRGLTYQQTKPQIYQTLAKQKETDALKTYFAELRKKANITYNKNWLKNEEKRMSNPIKQVLKSKLPTMVDFGSDNCLPCIQMKPIVAELQKEYKDKANILLLDVDEYPDLTRKYQIVVIPTQIFFDTSGNETYRHMGFYPKADILTQLRKAGLK
uniref:Thioredoxin domain-containing protein n=1 Tax=candidate division WOR-3 bacterium TaxID=2052148 RepID=A0A7C6A9N8_UNCW3